MNEEKDENYDPFADLPKAKEGGFAKFWDSYVEPIALGTGLIAFGDLLEYGWNNDSSENIAYLREVLGKFDGNTLFTPETSAAITFISCGIASCSSIIEIFKKIQKSRTGMKSLL